MSFERYDLLMTRTERVYRQPLSMTRNIEMVNIEVPDVRKESDKCG